MTIEELIKCLIMLKEQARSYGANTFVWDISIDSFNYVIDMAIKALGQEPCDDAIDRKYLTGLMFTETDLSDAHTCYESIRKIVEEMPSVTPIRPKGHWIGEKTLIPNNEYGHIHQECSCCGKFRIVDNFCPNCGADMRGGEND